MYWQKWSQALKELLALEGSPVAVTYSHAGVEGAGPQAGKVSVCQAVRRAAEGETLDLTAENSGCPGGLVSLGLGEMPPGSMEWLTDFLVHREKAYCSPVAIYRGQQTVRPPRGVATHIVFAPLEKATLQPDVVLFLCHAQQAEQVVALCNYWEGGSLQAELAGPACRTAVGFPVVTGQVGLSLLDFGARRLGGYRPEQLLLGVPLARMHTAMAALEQGAGRMELHEDAAALERRVEELAAA